ncbi:MAG: ribonuclease P protein component [Pseudomonadota bacterium]
MAVESSPTAGPRGASVCRLNTPETSDVAPYLRRLKQRAQFLYVRAGVSDRRASVVVEARNRPEPADDIGVGFTATKKIGNAVVRNRAKRRLRAAASELLPRFGVPGVDYVLIARARTVEASWPRLLDDLESALISVARRLEARDAPGGAPEKKA